MRKPYKNIHITRLSGRRRPETRADSSPNSPPAGNGLGHIHG